MPIYVERAILDLPKIYINGGRRGYLVGISALLQSLLQARAVECALEE
jgi:prolyl-tRNA editing enzyme YbaK/EbsC (Cys-tRNA(Pro) deacylase)